MERYEIEGDGEMVHLVDNHKAEPAGGGKALADPPLGGPVPRDLAEAVLTVVNVAERHQGGNLSGFAHHATETARALERFWGLAPSEPLEVFRMTPADLWELSTFADSLSRHLTLAAANKRQLVGAVADLLAKAAPS